MKGQWNIEFEWIVTGVAVIAVILLFLSGGESDLFVKSLGAG